VEGAYCGFHNFVDVAGLKRAWSLGGGGIVGADDIQVSALRNGENCMNPSSECAYGTSFGVGGVVADDAASSTVFLVSDAHGCFSGGVQRGEACCVGYDVVLMIIECDVACAKLFCAASVLFAMSGVFPHAEKIVERNCGHVANCLDLGRRRCLLNVLEVGHKTYGDCKFVLDGRVMSLVGLNESFEGEPIPAFAAVGRVGPSVHLEGLADGTYRDLNGCSSDASSVAAMTVPDPLSECGEKFDSLGRWHRGEHGVHTSERVEEFAPMFPIALPFLVIRLHDPSVDVSPHSSEKTCEASLLLNRKTRHESCWSGREAVRNPRQKCGTCLNLPSVG